MRVLGGGRRLSVGMLAVRLCSLLIDYFQPKGTTTDHIKHNTRKVSRTFRSCSTTLQVLRTLVIFRCTADTGSSRSNSRFCNADTSGLAVLRGSLLWILPILTSSISGLSTSGTASTVLQVLYCKYCTGSISFVGTASIASTRSTKTLSTFPVCL